MHDFPQTPQPLPAPVLVGNASNQAPPPIDKGFCYLYYRLSYRRKLIRTLWLAPFLLLIPLLPAPLPPFSRSVTLFLFALLVVTGVIQAGYNYIKWQAEVKAAR